MSLGSNRWRRMRRSSGLAQYSQKAQQNQSLLVTSGVGHGVSKDLSRDTAPLKHSVSPINKYIFLLPSQLQHLFHVSQHTVVVIELAINILFWKVVVDLHPRCLGLGKPRVLTGIPLHG